MIARVLIIAGSDSGGGAGIQGDSKTVSALGGYAASAITALTAQNTQGVFGIHEVPVAFIRKQISLVLDDIGADAIKTGMLHSKEIIEAVAEALSLYGSIPYVLDPVMVAKGGAALLKPDAILSLKTRLIPRAAVLTPNIPEAALLADMPINTPDDMEAAARKLLLLGCESVLLKGGHLEGAELVDVWVSGQEVCRFHSKRIASRGIHGTGCALASAIATGIAQQKSLKQAVEEARHYVAGAIKHAPGLGQGYGPLAHGWMQNKCET